MQFQSGERPTRAGAAETAMPEGCVTGQAGATPDDYALIRRAVAFLSREWGRHPGLDELAAELGLEPTRCQKLFKRWCGLSPKEFVGALSHDYARGLLRDSESVMAAAHGAGLSGSGRLHDLFISHEAMAPGVYKSGCLGLDIAYGFHATPFGECTAAATEAGLAALAFADEDKGQTRDDVLTEIKSRWPGANYRLAPSLTQATVSSIFDPAVWSGERPVRVVFIGTDFEVRVWSVLARVPMGAAVAYRDIARAVGKPQAARAVGSAVGRNPLSFVVPCHRVLRADGGLAGYHWGLTRKRAIIGWEAAQLARRSWRDDG